MYFAIVIGIAIFGVSVLAIYNSREIEKRSICFRNNMDEIIFGSKEKVIVVHIKIKYEVENK